MCSNTKYLSNRWYKPHHLHHEKSFMFGWLFWVFLFTSNGYLIWCILEWRALNISTDCCSLFRFPRLICYIILHGGLWSCRILVKSMEVACLAFLFFIYIKSRADLSKGISNQIFFIQTTGMLELSYSMLAMHGNFLNTTWFGFDHPAGCFLCYDQYKFHSNCCLTPKANAFFSLKDEIGVRKGFLSSRRL